MPRAPKDKPALTKVKAETTITPAEIQIGHMKLRLVGRAPFLYHKKSQKAWQTLLLGAPPSRKPADRVGILKHEPMKEFQESVYRSRDPNNDSLLLFPASAFRQAAQTAALDMAGVAKTEIGRWIVVEGGPRDPRDMIAPEPQDYVSIYGIPQISMNMVRNLGANRTPDVRCKAILPVWACEIFVHFAMPNLTSTGVMNLFNNGGILVGVGDGRQEKGKLNNGRFRVVDENDETFRQIKATGGRAAQERAMQTPEPIDEMTEEMLAWYDAELIRRRSTGQAPDELAESEDYEMAEDVC